jgi:thiamine monophosphate kinase
MTSKYLTQPCRTEAEALLDKCEAIRQAAANFQANIRKRIEEVGGDASCIDLADGLTDALYSVEMNAQEAVDDDEYRLDSRHIASERAYLGFKGWGQ